MKRLLIIALLFAANVAFANDTIIWTIPTQRVGGAALPAAEIAKYQIWVDDVLAVDNITATSTQAAVTVSPGTHTFKMRTIDTEGRIGPFSVALSKVIKGPPGAPVVVEIKFIP